MYKMPMQRISTWFRKSGRSCLAVLVAIAGVALAGWGSRNTYVQPPPPKVVVAQPVQQPVTLYLELTGNTAAFRSVNLVARVQGYLELIDYKDGATVTKGTQLFGIESDLYQAQVDQAKGQLAHDEAVLAMSQIDLDSLSNSATAELHCGAASARPGLRRAAEQGHG